MTDKRPGPRFRLTLQSRFLFWFTLLLVFLVGTILLVIEQREVATIFEESKNTGLLLARGMAERNLQSMIGWDLEGLQRDIEAHVNETLVFVVIYDRFATPIVYSRSVLDQRDLFAESQLPGGVKPDGYAAAARDVRLDGRDRNVLEVEVPAFFEGSPDKWGSVKIGLSLEDMRAEIRRTRLTLLFIGLGGFLLGLAGAVILSRRITRPLQKLVEGTVRVAKGDFGHSIEAGTVDEISDLARSFNDMAGKLLAARRETEEAQRRLVQSEKLAQIGRLAASIAHEIRNPLTSVKLNIQKVLEDGGFTETDREHLSLSQEGIAQIEKFIKEMLNFTRATDLQKAPFALEQIIDESVKMIRDCFREKRISMEKRIEPGLPEVLVDGDRLRQVILNLLRNASEAVGPEGGRVVLAAEVVEEAGRRRLRIRVSDNGTGIPEKDWENVFEPFFTTKSWGIGLGLANARKLVELHRGTIRVVRKRGPGTAFEIHIPIEREI